VGKKKSAGVVDKFMSGPLVQGLCGCLVTFMQGVLNECFKIEQKRVKNFLIELLLLLSLEFKANDHWQAL